jgi:hypothetical protein
LTRNGLTRCRGRNTAFSAKRTSSGE